MEPPFLSVVAPAYNEASRIVPTLTRLADFLASQGYAWEIVVADDGSTDATAQLVEGFARDHAQVRLARLPHKGKGHAVKAGMMQATGRYRFLCDADLSMPPEHIPRFLPPQLEGVDVAIGSREAPGARRIDEPWHRHLMGRVFNALVRLLALPGIADSQCGFKCFTARAAEAVFPLQRTDGFGFDAEVLFLARRRGMRLQEVPIDWHYQPESKVRPMRDTFQMVADLVRLRWNHWRGVYERRDG